MHYYHSYMRDYFVGGLFALGSFMYLYKGFSWQENYALNVAGILAILIAVVPTDLKSVPPIAQSPTSQVHMIFAIAFLLTIGYVCVFRSADTLPLLRPGRRRRMSTTIPISSLDYAWWQPQSPSTGMPKGWSILFPCINGLAPSTWRRRRCGRLRILAAEDQGDRR